MATKYVIEGATYCGNGTADNEAASAGAAGAWNVFLGASGVFENAAPAYGSLAAGDTVIVRSKTGNGVNANLTRTVSSNISLGSSAATSTAWITWILDNGVQWPGIDGTATWTTSASSLTITLRDYNKFVCLTQDAFALVHGAVAHYGSFVLFGTSYGCKCENILIDASACTSYGPNIGNGGLYSVFTNLHFKQGLRGTYAIGASSQALMTLINPDIELTNATQTLAVFRANTQGARLDVYGGKLRGAGAGTGVAIADITTGGAGVNLYGTQVPAEMAWPTTYPNVTALPTSEFNAFGSDAKAGAMKMAVWGKMDSNKTGNYPFLNATLPDSVSSGWSWKVWLENGGVNKEFFAPIQELYTSAAAAKTVTVHLNVSDTMTAGDLINQSNLWMEVMYVQDSDGATRSITTKIEAPTALTAGPSSAWSLATYGPVTLIPKKLEVTTPTAIKQNTLVQCVLRSTYGSAVTSHIFFLDPSMQLS